MNDLVIAAAVLVAVGGGYAIGAYIADTLPTQWTPFGEHRLSSQWGGAIGSSLVLAAILYYVHIHLDQEVVEWLDSF